MKQRGLSDGFKAFLEFRQAMAWHTDTNAAGPFTAQQLIDAAKSPSPARPGPQLGPASGSARAPRSLHCAQVPLAPLFPRSHHDTTYSSPRPAHGPTGCDTAE